MELGLAKPRLRLWQASKPVVAVRVLLLCAERTLIHHRLLQKDNSPPPAFLAFSHLSPLSVDVKVQPHRIRKSADTSLAMSASALCRSAAGAPASRRLPCFVRPSRITSTRTLSPATSGCRPFITSVRCHDSFEASKANHHPTSSGTGVKSTLPSSAEPIRPSDALSKLKKEQRQALEDGDRGYLAFTKASLFKLTLPLSPPDEDLDPQSPTSKASSPLARSMMARTQQPNSSEDQAQEHRLESESDTGPIDPEPWEKRVDRGQRISQVESDSDTGNVKRKGRGGTSAPGVHGPEQGEPADDQAQEFDAKAPAKSVVFLLHSGQPLSYIASLIRAEEPSYSPSPTTQSDGKSTSNRSSSDPSLPSSQTFESAITFHTRAGDGKRWSPATGIGDFLRDAARVGTFVIRVGDRNIRVSVPSFEDRTRFLRATLYAKTGRIERMAKLKTECDALAHTGTRRFAIAGAGLGVTWWIFVSYATFFMPSIGGWDTMEPVTYLVGLGGLLGGYSWFLIHNREVSYRAVLSETTSRRQQKLYIEKGFNVEKFQEVVEEVRQLRKAIKNVAEDYDLEWDQGETMSGKQHKKALEVVRKTEALEDAKHGRKKKKGDEEDDEGDESDEEGEDLDEDGDGQPDGKQRVSSKSGPKGKVKV